MSLGLKTFGVDPGAPVPPALFPTLIENGFLRKWNVPRLAWKEMRPF